MRRAEAGVVAAGLAAARHERSIERLRLIDAIVAHAEVTLRELPDDDGGVALVLPPLSGFVEQLVRGAGLVDRLALQARRDPGLHGFATHWLRQRVPLIAEYTNSSQILRSDAIVQPRRSGAGA